MKAVPEFPSVARNDLVLERQPEILARRLGFFPVYNIVVANMIGAGVFTTSGLLMENLGNPQHMILLWLAGGVIALCGALSYGVLGAAMPHAGGDYRFVADLFHPAAGFLSGWVSFVAGFSAPIAASAIGFSEYFLAAFPGMADITLSGGPVSLPVVKKMVAATLILLFVTIHTGGLKFGARLQNLLTMLKVALLVGLITAGFLWGRGNWEHFSVFSATPGNAPGWKSTGLSLLWIMFAYSGWNAATYIGSEIRNPGRNIPLALISGTLTVTVLYMLLNLWFVYALPAGDMKGVISVAGLAATRAFGEDGGLLLSLLISFALFSSLSAYLIIGPRVYFAMSRDGLFFKSVARLSEKTAVPSRAIWLQGILSILMVMTGTFEQILTYMGFALGIFPLVATAGIFKLKKNPPSGRRIPGYPYVQLIFLGTGFIMLCLSFIERPAESLIAIGTVATGLPVYLLFRKAGSKPV